MRTLHKAQMASALALLLCCCGSAFADEDASAEPAAIVEVGVAPSWNISDARSSVSPTLAVETTPVEHWLELELGVTPTFNRQTTEWDADLLFKKPWTLTPKIEFMFGAGPVWIHTSTNHISTNSLGGEVALDFMFWPASRRRFGWYLEPAYQYDFGAGHEQSFGISAGLLVAIRR